jgi:hypothetical protein
MGTTCKHCLINKKEELLYMGTTCKHCLINKKEELKLFSQNYVSTLILSSSKLLKAIIILFQDDGLDIDLKQNGMAFKSLLEDKINVET